MARPDRNDLQTVAALSPAAGSWKREALLVLTVIAIGVAFRFAFPGRMAIEHFDEGVYASNRWFTESQQFQFPNRHLYAPPLLPWLIEWSLILFGPSNFSAMIPSLVAGCLTIPLLWWVVRYWAGTRAALAAAILIAGSDLHIAFSRTALTDALLLFWLLAAVGAGSVALGRRSWIWAIASGVLVGLAWWTKYNGWLALAILGSGGVAWSLLPGQPLRDGDKVVGLPQGTPSPDPFLAESRWRRLGSTLGIWLIISVVGVATWAPYWWSLQDHGGYAAVAANHRGYFVGWSGWWNSFLVQQENLIVFHGWMSVISVALAVLLPPLLPVDNLESFTWNRTEFLMRICLALLMAVLSVVPWMTLGFVAAFNMLMCIFCNLRGRIIGWVPRASLGIWLSAAWFCGLLVAVPLYTPYPRLILPWWLAGVVWLATAVSAMPLSHHLTIMFVNGTLPPSLDVLRCLWESKRYPESRLRWSVIALCGVGVVSALGLLLVTTHLNDTAAPGWDDRSACQKVSEEVITQILDDLQQPRGAHRDQFAIYVYGEPGLFFQLRLDGAVFVVPISHLEFAKPKARPSGVPTYLVTGPHADRPDSRFRSQLLETGGRLQMLKHYPLFSSRLVRRDEQLDQSRSDDKGADEPPEGSWVTLWKVLDPPGTWNR